jgi:hypothetical protein
MIQETAAPTTIPQHFMWNSVALAHTSCAFPPGKSHTCRSEARELENPGSRGGGHPA